MKHIEDSIHKSIMQFLWRALPSDCLAWHTPNQAGTRTIAETKRLKSMGVLPGIPDILIWNAKDSRLIGIEVKSPKGVLSKSQKQLFPKLDSLGIPVHVCRSIDEVQAALDIELIELKVRVY